MSGHHQIRDLVQRAVSAALTLELPKLRDEIIGRVLDELQPALAHLEEGTPTEHLRAATAAIEGATAQSDVLRALLDGAAKFTDRTALFVVRGASAVGWQARGFRENDAIKLLTIDLNLGLGARSYQQRAWIHGPAVQFEPRLVAGFGAPVDGNCLVIPLVIREKVTALMYADMGPRRGGNVDTAALEVLVRTASVWVEVLALRKNVNVSGLLSGVSAAAAPGIRPSGPPLGGAPAMMPPAASFTMEHEPAKPAGRGVSSSTALSATAVAVAPDVPHTVLVGAAEPDQELEPASSPHTTVALAGAISADEEEVHRKARRFAKLLVDEIKLYNQSKLKEGKQRRDLYDRLRDDIEKSRNTYDQRYGNTVAGPLDYFRQELVRNLADNKAELLGTNFPR